jgi:hypothetical protein
MHFVVASAFRNAAGRQVSTWISQCLALHRELRDHYYCSFCSFRAIAVEGDSTDRTAQQLGYEAAQRGLDLTLVRCHHGGPIYGSTEQPERMVALSKVGNAILDAVDERDDVLVYVESDLLWDAETIRRLIDKALYSAHARSRGKNEWFDIYSPLVMAGDLFYDVWATRDLDGNRFSPFPPFHHGLQRAGLMRHGQMMEVSSTGSCLVMPASVARDTRVRMTTGALVEWCEKARAVGYRIAVDPSCVVRHPA